VTITKRVIIFDDPKDIETNTEATPKGEGKTPKKGTEEGRSKAQSKMEQLLSLVEEVFAPTSPLDGLKSKKEPPAQPKSSPVPDETKANVVPEVQIL
jgi:hypothetical protein